MKITIHNYRAFDGAQPVEWQLEDDFRAFVGINNSGKSSLLRFFHEIRPALVLFCQGDANARQLIGGRAGVPAQFLHVADPDEVFCNRNSRDMSVQFGLMLPRQSAEHSEPSAVRFIWNRRAATLSIRYEFASSDRKPVGNFKDNSNKYPIINVDGREVTLDLSRYLAILRDLAGSMYIGAFRNAVNVGGNENYYDLQIGQDFISQWDSLKSGSNRKHNRMALAVERELQEIFGLKGLQINAAPGNETLQVIADGQPYQLAEQGAGLAQFVVVMAFIATQRPAYVFIDEPEQNLHPSLQLDFLTTLAKYTTRGVVFATHSIGLARAVAQEIYSVRRLADGSREVRQLSATRDYVEFLGELGLSGYEELGFNQVLLVEGTTEVPIIQRWLRLYGKEHQVVLVPLGGSSMINGRSEAALAEIKRITHQVAVLIDSERSEPDAPLTRDRQVFVETCGKLGFTVHVLQRRALENYLTDGAIKAVKGDKYSALGEHDSLKDHPMAWGKNENWRIASMMNRDDLDGTDLGEFLSSIGEG